MSTCLETFEVRVKLRNEQPTRWRPWKDCNEFGTIIKMYLVEARTQDQARERAEKKYGRVISCRKANYDKIVGDVSNLPIKNNMYVKNNAIDMDEMLWNKSKRAKRLNINMQKDKEIN